MERIVLKHLSGSKTNQEDEFPLDRFSEITLGRNSSSSVMFSDETEVMVGRHHARITRNPALPSMFLITDLSSRNGTFVNRQRIFGAAPLKPGDVVQCGFGGPEFRFDVEPATDQLNAGEQPRQTVEMLIPERSQLAPSTPPPLAPLSSPPPSISSPDSSPIFSARVSYGKTANPASPASPASLANLVDVVSDELSGAPAESRARKRTPVIGGILIGCIVFLVGFVAYSKFQPNSLSGAEKPGTTPRPNAAPNASLDASEEKYGHVHFNGSAAEAEKDEQRAAWRIEVAPYLTLGGGRPGHAPSDFDKPAGLAFSPAGMLLAADAGNRRVQVWNVKTGSRLAEFGADVFSGEIDGVAVTPDNHLLVTDRLRGLAYVFAPPLRGPYDYQFKGPRFGEQGFTELGGVAVDSKGRAYVVDASGANVLRFNSDGAMDRNWNFEKSKAGGDAYLLSCDEIAIDEAGGNLFVASEKHAIVEVFDWETGAYKNRTIGAGKDASGKPAGKSVFFGSVKGMTIANRRLLAVDESAGHIQIFDIERPDAFNTDLAGYAPPRPVRDAGYQGYFGNAPLFDFEDRTNSELQRQVKDGAVIPGKANPPGHFCSPGAIAGYSDPANGETYIAVADQCNYRIAVYRWSDIAKALGGDGTAPGATLATNKVAAQNKSALAAASKPTAKPTVRFTGRPTGEINKNIAPGRGKVTSPNRAGNPINAGNVTTGGKVKPANGAKAAVTAPPVTASGKNKQTANISDDATATGKKAKKVKKAKKAEKVKY